MALGPLPLLGTFHEISIATHDVRAAVEFYERLGFTQAPTTDAFAHRYGVLTDGRLAIGLHGRASPSPTLTFVRPGVAAALPGLAAAGIALSTLRVGEDVFNEVAFADPFGQAVALLEARTYSPASRGASEPSLCGDFAEISLPVSDFAVAQAFWERLGFVASEETQTPYRHLSLTSDHIDLAFHAPQLCRRPMLVFRDAGLAARLARLRALGLTVHDLVTEASGAATAALLEDGAGTTLLLAEAEL
jgi:catechol 2,3-dioxygenase-like lactoylglutathione lyase family enzyme